MIVFVIFSYRYRFLFRYSRQRSLTYPTDNVGRRYRTIPDEILTRAVELAVSSYLSQSTRILSNSQVGRVWTISRFSELNGREPLSYFNDEILYASYREKEENVLLVDRWQREKSFHAVAKAKFYIQYRRDKVPTGSFPYFTQRNCNRVKPSPDTSELIGLHTRRDRVLSDSVRYSTHGRVSFTLTRELNQVKNYATCVNIEIGKNVKSEMRKTFLHSTQNKLQLAAFRTPHNKIAIAWRLLSHGRTPHVQQTLQSTNSFI